jgi:uncharacterized membrane protein YoaK (UPF0700 family)
MLAHGAPERLVEMFRSHGATRTHRQNAMLAGYLALVAGYVNSAGFVVVGTFTSHATGNVARFADELVSQRFAASGAALLLVAAFFGGAFAASLILESHLFARSTSAYGAALLLEASLLGLFVVLAGAGDGQPRAGWLAALLATAMGMQNSLVTRLSGAVVRTTHLTGVVTDLGIESARWVRAWLEARLASGGQRNERASGAKMALLATIAGSFTMGAVLGGAAGLGWKHLAMVLPGIALAGAAAYAFATPATGGSVPPPRSR